MPRVHFGRKDEPATDFVQSEELIAVRTRSALPRGSSPVRTSLGAVTDGPPLLSFPEANVAVYRVDKPRAEGVEAAKSYLESLSGVRFAGHVLVEEGSGEPVVYTENLFVKFVDEEADDHCVAVLAEHGLTVKRKVEYARNAYFAAAPEGIGQKVFEIAQALLARDDVEFCHPEIVRRRASKAVYPQQWHLHRTAINGHTIDAHAGVEAALELATGRGVTIAVIDDGVDTDHSEFAGKVTAARDVTLGTNDARPKDTNPWYPDDHGTACAGVACAAGVNGASGVAPEARLMAIRCASALGAQAEADAFYWAAAHGADIISCSWGPPDGKWFDPEDPAHTEFRDIPASTRLAIDHAATRGRDGKGCVILFAAGNGSEGVEYDGYASYPRVIAVAACNDRGVRSAYSDYGAALWCSFPSNDFEHPPTGRPAPLTPGIWTTDRRGTKGYNPGAAADGDPAGNFTSSFGGTSSACPGVAGVAALILSANPDLTRDQVKSILAESCDKIDQAGGNYDANGWSPLYGYGRVNAEAAVRLAQQA